MAVIYLLRGVALVFVPEKLFDMYGASLDSVAYWNAQFMGGALLFIGLVNWFASRDTGNPFLRNVIISNIIFQSVCIIVTIRGASLFNSMVWPALGLDFLFVVLFVWLLFSGNAEKK